MSPPKIANQITIQTPRLLIRPMTLADVADIFLIRSDPETVRCTPISPDTSIEQTRDWIQRILTTGKDLNFSIELRGALMTLDSLPPQCVVPSTMGDIHLPSDATPKVIGFLSATRIPEIGYAINRDLWNRGLMTEVLKGFEAAYWDLFPEGYPGLEGEEKDCLTARTDKRNLASQAVLKKCGFEWWKEERREAKGEEVTVVWYRVWRSHPGKLKGKGYDWENSSDTRKQEKLDEYVDDEVGLWTTFTKSLMRYVGR